VLVTNPNDPAPSVNINWAFSTAQPADHTYTLQDVAGLIANGQVPIAINSGNTPGANNVLSLKYAVAVHSGDTWVSLATPFFAADTSTVSGG
jgi:hypothetical protein